MPISSVGSCLGVSNKDPLKKEEEGDEKKKRDMLLLKAGESQGATQLVTSSSGGDLSKTPLSAATRETTDTFSAELDLAIKGIT